ncbi:MAG: hypothetical protein KBT88_07460 [Gammaproteobacteria bacterium]|nr:hypothetical protein [Gammaproteobacteria bacterium]MBQ0839609.1 hypothetical protein [Gammaproteobacteria bacterium]
MTSFIDPQLSATPESKHSSRRRSSSRVTGSHHSRTRLIQVLGIALALSLMINLLMAIALASYVRKANLASGVSGSLRQQLTDFSEQSESQTSQIKTLEHEIKELTLKRLPGLIGLNYDDVIQVDKQYVKNIVFTRTGKKGAQLYEYKVVLENRDAALQPAFKILLFDRNGVQVGVSELSNKTDRGAITRLDQDEVRSHYSVVRLPDSSEPEYFQIILL